MEWLQSLLDSSSTPVATAFLLGLLTAISPCPLATNIAAISYISKDVDNRSRILRNGLFYTLGRTMSYALLGIVLIAIIRHGASAFGLQDVLAQWSTYLLGPLLMVIGLYMLLAEHIHIPHFGMLIPMSAYSRAGWLLPVVFALATALPVVLVAWVLAYSLGKIGQLYHRMKILQKWGSIAVGLVFMLTGTYLCFNTYIL